MAVWKNIAFVSMVLCCSGGADAMSPREERTFVVDKEDEIFVPRTIVVDRSIHLCALVHFRKIPLQ
jgi:hypothetical protein